MEPEYAGKNRRADCGGRRDSDECIYHEAHEVKFASDEKDIRANTTCILTLKEEMKTKVPSKLFFTYASAVFFLIISILGVQWSTYLTINEVALDHANQMGSINTQIAEVKLEIKHGNKSSEMAREAIKSSLTETTIKTETAMNDIKKQIEKLDK